MKKFFVILVVVGFLFTQTVTASDSKVDQEASKKHCLMQFDFNEMFFFDKCETITIKSVEKSSEEKHLGRLLLNEIGKSIVTLSK